MNYQEALISEFDRETAKTRKMLEAIPADADFNYAPHPKSMSLGRLASHLSDCSGVWASHTLTVDKLEFPADHKFVPNIPASKEAMLEKFDAEVAKAKGELAAFPAGDWDKHWQFIFGGQVWIDNPKHQVFREMVISHMVHHRAQLGVYIRLLGAKIPGAYGPSADEM